MWRLDKISLCGADKCVKADAAKHLGELSCENTPCRFITERMLTIVGQLSAVLILLSYPPFSLS